MTEKRELQEWAKQLDDETLLEETYDAIYDCLGSLTERMYDLGYDFRDIQEQEENEKFYRLKSDILEAECDSRGLELFNEANNA